MAIYRLGDLVPAIDPEAYVHPDAVVIGDVTLGPRHRCGRAPCSAGDYGTITVGARTSVQDGTVIHAGPGFPPSWGQAASSAIWPISRDACSRTTAWSARDRWSSTTR